MDNRAAKLVARVAAINRAGREANLLYGKLVAVFEPLVGQKIEKNDGGLMEKYKKLLPAFPDSNACHVYKLSSNYSLGYVVKTCEPVPPGTCVYHETTVYIGEMQGGVLVKLASPFEARSDYRVEDVLAARERYKEAKRLADEAHSALHPFGEYDN